MHGAPEIRFNIVQETDFNDKALDGRFNAIIV